MVSPNRTTSIAGAVAGTAIILTLFPVIVKAAIVLGVLGGLGSYIYQVVDESHAAPAA